MLTPEEEKMTIKEIREQMKYLETETGYLRDVKLSHLKLLLRYKQAKEKHELSVTIKNALGTKHVSGTYSKELTAQVLGITERQLSVIEDRSLRLLKIPTTFGKQLKLAYTE